jgi:hypothetical protein
MTAITDAAFAFLDDPAADDSVGVRSRPGPP